MSTDFFQPGHTYRSTHTPYTAPELILTFRVEHVTSHPDRGHLRAIGWSRTNETGAMWHGDFRDEHEFGGWTDVTDPGDVAELTVYRAEHLDSGITLGHYSTPDAARAHCEAVARREQPTASLDWIADDEDAGALAELVAAIGEDEQPTGYVVTPLEVASEYDEEAADE